MARSKREPSLRSAPGARLMVTRRSGNVELGRDDARAHPLARLHHRAVRQPHDLEARHPAGDVRLDLDGHAVETDAAPVHERLRARLHARRGGRARVCRGTRGEACRTVTRVSDGEIGHEPLQALRRRMHRSPRPRAGARSSGRAASSARRPRVRRRPRDRPPSPIRSAGQCPRRSAEGSAKRNTSGAPTVRAVRHRNASGQSSVTLSREPAQEGSQRRRGTRSASVPGHVWKIS